MREVSGEKPTALSWSLDVPDVRDYGLRHKKVAKLFRSVTPLPSPASDIDLRPYCPDPPVCQSSSSAALSVVGLVEYYEQRSFGRGTHYSPLFLDRVCSTMNSENRGATHSLRGMCKTLDWFGGPPSSAWSDESDGDSQPDAFAFAIAGRLAGATYIRLDKKRHRGSKTLKSVRRLLAAGLPCVFGFAVHECVTESPDIPFPAVFHELRGGQTAIAVGYDDEHRVHSDKGALLIRPHWGTQWGENGFGWLPYSYILEDLAADFWTLAAPRWLSSGEFYSPC